MESKLRMDHLMYYQSSTEHNTGRHDYNHHLQQQSKMLQLTDALPMTQVRKLQSQMTGKGQVPARMDNDNHSLRPRHLHFPKSMENYPNVLESSSYKHAADNVTANVAANRHSFNSTSVTEQNFRKLLIPPASVHHAPANSTTRLAKVISPDSLHLQPVNVASSKLPQMCAGDGRRGQTILTNTAFLKCAAENLARAMENQISVNNLNGFKKTVNKINGFNHGQTVLQASNQKIPHHLQKQDISRRLRTQYQTNIYNGNGKRHLATLTETEVRPRNNADQTKMAAYLVCLTSDGGVPLFTRKTANFKSLPFPVVASLNGVHMFAKSHDSLLLNCFTKDTRVVWRDFNDSVKLILAVTNDNGCESHLYEFLGMVFHAMVLHMGMNAILNSTNVERLKRDLKCCFATVDALLLQLTQSTEALPFIGDISHSVDCIVCSENALLQEYLNTFVESVSSMYGCLLIHGKVAIATKEWWLLDGREMILLSLFIHSMQHSTCHDVPIFLPVGSPTEPYRLVVIQLIQGVEVCVLCGRKPTLTNLSNKVLRLWKGAYELLRNAVDCHPQSFPNSITLDTNILGFVLVNHQEHKVLCSVHPSSKEVDPTDTVSKISPRERIQILRTFFKLIFYTLFSRSTEDGLSSNSCLRHSCQETYLSTTTHKLYALQADAYWIIVLYSNTMPTFALRSVTRKTLNILTQGRQQRF